MKNTMQAFLFPGQGSQKRGMGQGLFDEVEQFVAVESRIDTLLGYSLRELCLEDPQRRLNETQYTQPALFVVNALHALHALHALRQGERPVACAGHSLGEYNALLVAGCFDLLTGVRLVQKRGELMARARNGGMAAVVGLVQERIQDVLRQEGLSGIDVANFNAPSQIVISGPNSEIQRAVAPMQAAGASAVVPLAVSAAFHSRYMAPAASAFAEFLAPFEFKAPGVPVIANVTGEPVEARGDASATIKSLLVRQISTSVQWVRTMRHLLSLGPLQFRELGPGNVLTRLASQFPQVETSAAVAASARPAAAIPAESPRWTVSPQQLGSAAFREDYRIRMAYLCGAMYKGIASVELVVALGRAGLMGFLGTGGLSVDAIDSSIRRIKSELLGGQSFGMNLLASPDSRLEGRTVDLYLEHGVRHVEAAAYMQITQALVRYRLKGARVVGPGRVDAPNRLLAKISRPEVASVFMRPSPPHIVEALLRSGQLTPAEAEAAPFIPVAQDICVEADSGGHTDQGVAYALMPAMAALRGEVQLEHAYAYPIRIGAAGGIGTPEAAAAAFILGADFVVTGSINQCTVEAGTSDAVKDLLQDMNVQDTAYAPAGDMFELGAQVQVLKKGLFFPMRANKLYELYMRHNSLEEIDEKTRKQIEDKYFRRSFDEVWAETRAYYQKAHPELLEKVERSPKQKMAFVFRWYFIHTSRLALAGNPDQKVDYQVHCGPALGAFNQWVKGTAREGWRARRVGELGDLIMTGAADVLSARMNALLSSQARS